MLTGAEILRDLVALTSVSRVIRLRPNTVQLSYIGVV